MQKLLNLYLYWHKMKIEELRKLFPELKEKIYGKPLVYLDNAATSLRPSAVLAKWEEMAVSKNANIYRANHRKAIEATAEVEAAREAVRSFLGAASTREIIFTSGSTASLNLLAYSFGEAFVGEGDEIILAESEHHSDIVPWHFVCERKGAVIKLLPVDDNGALQVERLEELITPRTRIVCVAHVSNVLGLVNPIARIVEIAHSKAVPVAVDGAQGILHGKVDVKSLGCDFYVFSGHKIYAAPGTGVLYGREDLLEKMPPWQGGGEMISTVSWDGISYAGLPFKFEAGTPNIAGIPTLVPALELASQLSGEDYFEETAITEYLLGVLESDSDIVLYGNSSSGLKKIPLFSFSVKGAHHEDLAILLDKMGVAVRSGQLCAEPLMARYGVTGMLRASFGAYNTLAEAEYFVESLHRAIEMLRQ